MCYYAEVAPGVTLGSMTPSQACTYKKLYIVKNKITKKTYNIESFQKEYCIYQIFYHNSISLYLPIEFFISLKNCI